MIDIKYFLDNNSGGQKTREKWLLKNNVNYHSIIKDWSNKNGFNDLPYKEQIYLCCNSIRNIPTCYVCEKKLKFKKSLSEGYPEKYCSINCMNSSEDHKIKVKDTKDYGLISNKIKKTTFKNYGVDNIFKRTDIIKNSYKRKYGVDHPLKDDGIKAKQKKTIFEKYGDWVINDNNNRFKLELLLKNKTNEFYPNLNIIDNQPYDLLIKCNYCNKDYNIKRALLRYRYNNNINPCTICNPILTERSIKEKELSVWLSQYTEVIRKDRLILDGKEIDIFLPEFNIGIEFNGLYYHSNLFLSDDYHLNKTLLAESKGVRLIHIFEDEWISKTEIIKSILLNLISKTPNRVYARKCSIKEVSSKDCKTFLLENHIQGNSISSKNIGLFYNDELISLMTFGIRKITGKKDMELIRFCNKINTNVIGSASKLFNYFTNKYSPNKIISYQDIRLFNGNLYEKLNFTKIRVSKPSYYYIINKQREYRYNWRKDILVKLGFDKNKTEKEIMETQGYYRIYDCGSNVWYYEKL
jgi:hypothetical protein